ncbi:MAG: hypothetical protein K0M64_03730 [Rhizobium sp.]|nr:hypothetical protein [Rhizobium sp.]
MKLLMDKAARLGLQDLSGQGPTQPGLGASVDWQALPDVLLRDVIERLVKEQGNAVVFSVDDANNCCPGISTTIRVMISSLRNSFSSMSRIPKESDFADAVHTMYAPYVTIFRTDRYMAPIVSKQVSAYGTHVVRRLLDLPDAIEEALARAPRRR